METHVTRLHSARYELVKRLRTVQRITHGTGIRGNNAGTTIFRSIRCLQTRRANLPDGDKAKLGGSLGV